MSRAASQAPSMASRSGAIGLYSRAPPSHFANRILASATDVIEEVSSATVRTWSQHRSLNDWSFNVGSTNVGSTNARSTNVGSTGRLLTSRIERTERRAAIATSGTITR